MARKSRKVPVTVTLTFDDAQRLRTMFGVHDCHLRVIEQHFGVTVAARGERVLITGEAAAAESAGQVLVQMYAVVAQNRADGDAVAQYLQVLLQNPGADVAGAASEVIPLSGRRRDIAPRSPGQRRYIESIRRSDMVFGIGPAGTGKTYLAMAMAVASLLGRRVERIVLCRPAVEAGEKLGFLPGSMQEKVNPYLRPLYDALHDMMDMEQARRLLEDGIIEVAPLAFMRGRTLANSFVILDEAQNCTSAQMKMFLTRLGMSSKAVITGDITQIDLPSGTMSGLAEAVGILQDIPNIAVHYFAEGDVVRHPLVRAIVEAYDGATRARPRPRGT